jgi:hypothetical protein
MTSRVRLCAKCKQAIDAERIDCLPATRLCAACALQVEEKYGGEFRAVVTESKTGRKGSLKLTGVEYDVELERNQRVPLRFDSEEE